MCAQLTPEEYDKAKKEVRELLAKQAAEKKKAKPRRKQLEPVAA